MMGTEYYIERNLSETIKGVLIVLIVIGHNHVLCPNTEVGGMMDYLYMFHITGFFILPFFYQTTMVFSKKHIGDLIVRNWIPYVWICLLCWLCFSSFTKNFHFGLDTICSILMGTQTHLSASVGFVFPWFLPTYCTFSILLCLARKYNRVMFVMTLLSIWIGMWSWGTFYNFKNSIPLGIGLAFAYFGPGVISFQVRKIWSKSYLIAIPSFILLSISYWNHLDFVYLYKLFPICFFLLILELSKFLNTKFLRLLGRNSLGIYLFHMFFVNIVYRLFPHNTIWGIVGFVVSLIIPLLITILIYRLEFVRKLFFPRGLMDLKCLFK